MNRHGFTLLELLVVIVLISAVMLLVPPIYARGFPGTEIKGAARELAAGLRLARSMAIAGNREVALTLNVEDAEFWIEDTDKRHRLPPNLALSMFTSESEKIDQSTGSIRFFEDGTSTGGSVTVGRGDQSYDVMVDWLLGRISIIH